MMQTSSTGNLQSWALHSLHTRYFGSTLSKLIMFGLLGTLYIQLIKKKKKKGLKRSKAGLFYQKKRKKKLRKGGTKIKFRPKAHDAFQGGAPGFMPACPTPCLLISRPPSAQPRQQSQRSPRLGLILVSRRRRLDNSCVLRGSKRRKV